MALPSAPAGDQGVAPAGAPVDVARTAGRTGGDNRLRERRLVVALFLGPALLVLAGLVAYPIVYTVWLSLHSADGSRFVGVDNYVAMFTSPSTRRAIENNLIWMLVAPSIVTALGLVFAVLIERVRLATAFKTILFMPLAISFLAAGVTFRLVYDESPDRGALNAALVGVHDAFAPPSRYFGAEPRDGSGLVPDGGGFSAPAPPPGTSLALPLVGLAAARVPAGAVQAVAPDPGPGLRGVVWLDFTRGGGGTAGTIDTGERGLPDVRVEVVRVGTGSGPGDSGNGGPGTGVSSTVVARATTDSAGRFAFPDLTGSGYSVRLAGSNFTEPFRGLTWLGPSLVTPSLIGAYIWIWAGFAMVLISAGLASLPREALEAARVDGATEWQVFRRVTVPLVRPVLGVVLVTLMINVLKIFDLVLVLAPESAQDEANVIALQMYRVSFGGGLDYGLGSALGVLLFLLVLPAMLLNVRRMRRNQ